MIRPAALGLAVGMAAISAGTYYGLDLLPAGALGPFGRAEPEPTAGEAPAPPANTEVAAAAPAQPAPAAPATPAEQPMTEQDLAEEPPPEAAPAEAAAPAPAEPAPQEQPVAEAPAQRESVAPAPEPEPDAAPPPGPKPRKAAPAPAPAAESETTEVAKAQDADAPKQPKKAPPEADVIKPWWPDASKMPANQLKLQYAGQVQGEQAVALLFSAPLDVATLRQHAQVRTQTGGPVKGEWTLGKNPRLAVFRGVGSGRYTVILDPRIADTKGFMLGTKLQGPVYIQAQ